MKRLYHCPCIPHLPVRISYMFKRTGLEPYVAKSGNPYATEYKDNCVSVCVCLRGMGPLCGKQARYFKQTTDKTSQFKRTGTANKLFMALNIQQPTIILYYMLRRTPVRTAQALHVTEKESQMFLF